MESINEPWEGWEESFRKLAENGDDQLLIPDVFEDEIFKDWNPDNLT
jgi:antitoxin MazE